MRDDAELLRRYVEIRSEADFTELVGRYLGFVYHAALRRTGGRSDLAEDVTQYVFTALARNAARLIDHPVLAGWLYTTTQHAARRILRAERRRQTHEHEAQRMSETVSSEPEPEWSRLRQEIDGVMDQLPERDREAILLRFFHGQAFAQIGAAFGLNEDATRKRVERALDRLRGQLVKRGIGSTSAALAMMLAGEAARAAPVGLIESIASAALAHATGSGLPASGLLQFMSTKMTLGIAGVLGMAGFFGISAVGVAVYETREARRVEAEVALAQKDYESEAARLKQLQHSAEAADARVAELQTNAEQLRASLAATAQPPASVVAPVNKAAADARADAQKFFATFSQARPMLIEVGKAQVGRILGGFFRAAGLTAAQIDEIESRTAAYWGENAALTPGGIHPTVNYLPDDEMRQILGEEAFQNFKDYKRTEPDNGLAVFVSVAAGNAGAPLSNEQTRQLVQAFAGNSSSYQSGGNLDLNAVDWTAALAQAKAALTPAQWQAAQGAFLQVQYEQAVAAQRNAMAAAAGKPKS